MAKKKKQGDDSEGVLVVSTNKNARRLYEIFEVLEAGIQLLGAEVKSIRAATVNLKDSYVKERNGELFLVSCHISPYKFARLDAYDPIRDRKLLVHRSEIDRLKSQIREKGRTLIPMRMYFKKGRCKIEIGLGKGKKLFDKREDIKKKEAQRDMDRAVKR